MTTPALEVRDLRLTRNGTEILSEINWTVRSNERWIVLGPNGSGKTSLCRIASLHLHPSVGSVTVLGERLGRVDVRSLRARVAFASQAVAEMVRPDLTAEDVVVTAKHAALAPWWHQYDAADRTQARRYLDRLGCGHLASRAFGTLSSGERQRVQLARALMSEPGLIVLDEPTAGLDLAGREQLVGSLARLAADPDAAPVILVTHHVDEIPPGFSHVLMLSKGRVLASGSLSETLTEATLSQCFGMPLRLARRDGRWLAWSVGGESGSIVNSTASRSDPR